MVADADEDLNSRDRLIARAKAALQDDDSWVQPTIIEFAGTPKSGKSSCIDSVTHFFRRHDYRVLAPTEGASKRTPYFLKSNLLHYNAWSACYGLMQLLEGHHSADRYHLVFLDRGLFDSLVWFHLLREQDQIAPEEAESVHQFMTVSSWRELLDLVLLFTVHPESALERENSGKLVEKHGRAMNPDFLASLNGSYDQVRDQFAESFKLFHAIDTTPPTGLKQREAAAEVVDIVLAVMGA